MSNLNDKSKVIHKESICLYLTKLIYRFLSQYLILGAIVTSYIQYKEDKYLSDDSVFFMFFTYLLYLTNVLSSNTHSYLTNITDADRFFNLLANLFESHATKKFKVECYHLSDQYSPNAYNKPILRAEAGKLVTYEETDNFSYYSWKDVSGAFELKTKSNSLFSFNKCFVKLILNLEIHFADKRTKIDSDRRKQKLIKKCENMDNIVDFYEINELLGLDAYTLIKLPGNFGIAYFANTFWFAIFNYILPLKEFYSLYFNMFCTFQSFTIKKVISTRHDLNSKEHETLIELNFPKIIRNGNETVFDQPTPLVADYPITDDTAEPGLDEPSIELSVINNQEGDTKLLVNN